MKKLYFMPPYRYILEPYHGKNSRFTCPACKKSHQFTRYIDAETGEYLADNVGICNRLNSCGYHYSPKDYFRDNNIHSQNKTDKPHPKPRPVPQHQNKSTFPTFIPAKSSLKRLPIMKATT